MLFDADLLEHIRLIAREGDLSGEDREISEILDMHPEYAEIWNDPGKDPSRPLEINGQMVNPFVHVALHLIVGRQIRQGFPAEVKKAYLHLVERGEGEHEALHALMGWYGKLYFESVRKSDAFDESRYLQGLAFL
jgi:hypothetical protein